MQHTELLQVNRGKASEVFLDSGAPTQPISGTVLLALCICRQDRYGHYGAQSTAAGKQLSKGDTADHAG